MIQAVLAVGRVGMQVASKVVPAMGRGTGQVAGTAGKTSPKLAQTGGDTAKTVTAGPRGANQVTPKGSGGQGGMTPMDMVGLAADLVGMGDMVKGLLPKKPGGA